MPDDKYFAIEESHGVRLLTDREVTFKKLQRNITMNIESKGSRKCAVFLIPLPPHSTDASAPPTRTAAGTELAASASPRRRLLWKPWIKMWPAAPRRTWPWTAAGRSGQSGRSARVSFLKRPFRFDTKRKLCLMFLAAVKQNYSDISAIACFVLFPSMISECFKRVRFDAVKLIQAIVGCAQLSLHLQKKNKCLKN